jgi:hypothetical protein
MSRKKNGDILFRNLRSPGKIEILLSGSELKPTEDRGKGKIIAAFKKGALGSLKKSMKQYRYEIDEGIDTVLGSNVPWSIFTAYNHPEGDTSFKFLFPSNDHQVFALMVFFREGAPFNEAEDLISEIVMAVRKQGMN